MNPSNRNPEVDGQASVRSQAASSPGDGATRSTTELAHRALWEMQLDEFQTPVRAIVEIADHLLGDAKAQELQRFVTDMLRVRTSAVELQELIDDVLSGRLLNSAADAAENERIRSHARHAMRNKLNPVINYSELWLDEVAEVFLEAYARDLEMLRSLGKRCLTHVDSIVGSWGGDTVSSSVSAPDIGKIEEMVARMTAELGRGSTEKGRILVVDDNEVNRDILRRLLESQGHTVQVAVDGKQALDMITLEPIDVVLLDIVMPEMDGFTVLTRLKSDPGAHDIPVIIISALNEVDYVANCIKLGAEDYLHRPYSAVFLKARVGACLEKKRLREREIEHLELIERERKRADELLHVILPAEIVTELKTTNAVKPRRYDSVAVMFADIVDFTPYCERHCPEEVVDHLQRLVELWEETALRHSIQKIKTVGDAFMAACGLLTEVENPVLNCILCGLEMIEATQTLGTGWNLRVGIDFGQVVAGVLGRRQYLFDLFGDTVNTAARMESHGVNGRIVLSSEAWSEVKHLCGVVQLSALAVKGKGTIPRFEFEGFSCRDASIPASTAQIDELSANR